MDRNKYYNRLIEREWAKTCTTYSEAHFRAEKITRLEKLRDNGKQNN